MMAQKIRFIVNPGSGIMPKFNLETNVKELFKSPAFELEYMLSEYPGHPAILARDAVEKGYDIVVAAGGDGTVSEIASVLAGTNVKMGIVPGGSGNGIATKLGIPRSQLTALNIILKQQIKEIDAPQVNGKHFFSQCAQGYEALVSQRFAGAQIRGFLRYAGVIAQHYFQYKDRSYKIAINGKVIEEKMFFWEVTNSGSLGYGIKTVPNASMFDGQLELVVVKSFPKYWVFVMALLLVINKTHWSKYISIYPCTQLSVECEEEHIVQIDGDPLAEYKYCEIAIGPKKLSIFVP